MVFQNSSPYPNDKPQFLVLAHPGPGQDIPEQGPISIGEPQTDWRTELAFWTTKDCGVDLWRKGWDLRHAQDHTRPSRTLGTEKTLIRFYVVSPVDFSGGGAQPRRSAGVLEGGGGAAGAAGAGSTAGARPGVPWPSSATTQAMPPDGVAIFACRSSTARTNPFPLICPAR